MKSFDLDLPIYGPVKVFYDPTGNTPQYVENNKQEEILFMRLSEIDQILLLKGYLYAKKMDEMMSEKNEFMEDATKSWNNET